MAKENTKKGTSTKKKVTTKKTNTPKKEATKKATTKKTSAPKKEAVKKTDTAKKVEVKKEVVKKEETKKIETPKKEIKVEQIKAEKKKNIFTKKNIIIASSTLVVLILLIVGLIIFFSPKNIVSRKVKSMGKEYYSEYLWEVIAENRSKEELGKALSNYKEIGIKANLNTLSLSFEGKYKKEIEKKIIKKYNCDSKNTKAVIYPKNPYGKGNYKIKIELDCEF